jgi:hypothetical protein
MRFDRHGVLRFALLQARATSSPLRRSNWNFSPALVKIKLHPLNICPRQEMRAKLVDSSLASGPDRHHALRQIEAAQRKLRRGAVGGAHRIFEIDLPRLARQQ